MDTLRVYLSKEVETKIQSFNTMANDKEWLALLVSGTNDEITDGIYIKDPYLPFQKVNGTFCEVKDEEFANELVALNEKDDKFFSTICGWIHSHNNMSVFLSGTDESTHGDLSKYFDSNKVFVSIVVNNDMDMVGKVNLKLQYGNITIPSDVIIYNQFDENMIPKNVKSAFEKKVEIEVSRSYECGNPFFKNGIPSAMKILTKAQIQSMIKLDEDTVGPELRDKEIKRLQRQKGNAKVNYCLSRCFECLYNRWFDEEEIFEEFQKGLAKTTKKKEKEYTQTSYRRYSNCGTSSLEEPGINRLVKDESKKTIEELIKEDRDLDRSDDLTDNERDLLERGYATIQDIMEMRRYEKEAIGLVDKEAYPQWAEFQEDGIRNRLRNRMLDRDVVYED